MRPLATVVVTAFDRKEALKRLLIGLDNQSAKPDLYEVVVADDSGDARIGEQVVNGLDTRYELSLVKTCLPYEVNGVSVARNKGIQKARGAIIISIDDDCFPSLFFVEEHIAAHQKPYPVIVLGHRTCDASKLKEDRPIPITEPKAANELSAGRAGLLNFCNFMTGNISLPKQMVLETGLFDESFAQPNEHGYEDIELGYRLWRRGMPIIFSRNAMNYRPPTENEKDQRRRATKAVAKASQRLLRCHPLLPLVKQFIQAIHNGSQGQAVELGNKIVSRDSQHWPVLLAMGDLLSRHGHYEFAQQHLDKAMGIYSQNPSIHLILAQHLFRQKRFKEAYDHTLQTLALEPNQTSALHLLAPIARGLL